MATGYQSVPGPNVAGNMDRRLIALYATTIVMMTTFGLFAPFLPLLAQDMSISPGGVGLIFSMYPVGSLCISPVVGSLLYRLGRRNTLAATCILASVGFLASGVSVFLTPNVFIAINIVSRVVIGGACGAMFTVDNAVIAADYPDKLFKYIGLNESFAGLGLLLGPMFGAGLFELVGIAGTFFVSSACFFAFFFFIYAAMGADRPYHIVNNDEHILVLALEPRIVAATLPIVGYFFGASGIVVFLPTHLKDFGLSDEWVVASYTLIGIGYLVICVILAHTIERMNPYIVSSLALAVASIGFALIGPFPSFLPQHVATILIGWTLLPLASGALFIVITPSLISIATAYLGYANDDKLLDKLSGKRHTAIIVMAVAVGELFGPVITGCAVPYIGDSAWCGVLAGLGLALLVVYGVTFGCCTATRREAKLLQSDPVLP